MSGGGGTADGISSKDRESSERSPRPPPPPESNDGARAGGGGGGGGAKRVGGGSGAESGSSARLNPGFVDSPSSGAAAGSGAASLRSSSATAGCSASSARIFSSAARASPSRLPSRAEIARCRATSNWGCGVLLLAGVAEDLRGVLVAGKDLEHLFGRGDGRVEVAGVEALGRADEEPVRLGGGDPLLSRRGLGDERLERGDVDGARGVLGLVHELARRSEARVHLQDEVAPDEAIVALAFLEEIQRVPEGREDLVPDLARQRWVAGIRSGFGSAQAPLPEATGRARIVSCTMREIIN